MDGQCERFERLIIHYALGELERSERELLEEHVGSCPRCSSALEELQRLVSVLSRHEMVEPSAAVCDSVREVVRKNMHSPRKLVSVVRSLTGPFVRRPLVAGASAAALIAAATLLLIVPALRSPEEVSGKPTVTEGPEKVARGEQGHSAIVHDIRPARSFGDYLSDSYKVIMLIPGPDAPEVLAGHEWERWVADAMVLQEDKSLEGHWPLLSNLEQLYREITDCGGKSGEEEIGRITRLISEMNLVERTKEALDSER